MQISAVREAIAEAARTVVLPDGLPQLTCSGYVPDAVAAPHFFVAEYEQDFDKAMARGLDELPFTTRVLVGRGDDRAAQKLLDAMLSGSGPASIVCFREAGPGGAEE